MILYKKASAFTLMELVIGITIAGILAVSTMNMNFNRLNSKQKLDIFIGEIKTTFETVRNNALLGKGIGNNLDIPEKWKFDFSTNNSGTILYTSFDNDNNILNKSKIIFGEGMKISKIRCGELFENKSDYGILSDTGTVEFNGINISLDVNGNSDCDNLKDKILELTINNKTDYKIIEINTVNGLIEIK